MKMNLSLSNLALKSTFGLDVLIEPVPFIVSEYKTFVVPGDNKSIFKDLETFPFVTFKETDFDGPEHCLTPPIDLHTPFGPYTSLQQKSLHDSANVGLLLVHEYFL